MDNIDEKIEKVQANEAPQMKVMGDAAGSRTTAGGQQSNTMLASRADQPMGPMGNAAGFPSERDAANGQQTNGNAFMPDLTSIVQRYPLPSLFVGIGLGYLLSTRRSWR